MWTISFISDNVLYQILDSQSKSPARFTAVLLDKFLIANQNLWQYSLQDSTSWFLWWFHNFICFYRKQTFSVTMSIIAADISKNMKKVSGNVSSFNLKTTSETMQAYFKKEKKTKVIWQGYENYGSAWSMYHLHSVFSFLQVVLQIYVYNLLKKKKIKHNLVTWLAATLKNILKNKKKTHFRYRVPILDVCACSKIIYCLIRSFTEQFCAIRQKARYINLTQKLLWW